MGARRCAWSFRPACILAVAAGLSVGATSSRAQAGAASPSPSATAGVENTLAQRMQACVVCHGPEGRATHAGYLPRIAGKPELYLFNQLKNFQTGRRPNPAMRHLMQHMSDDYLRDIARHFSGLDLPYPSAPAHRLTADQQQRAEQLVFKGAPERQIPACVSCHGANLAGRLPAMPGLLGLPADYLIGQLGAWRTGLRKAATPDCMAEVARGLSIEEVSTVARWLAAQAPTRGMRADAGQAAPLPMRCGSGG